MCSITYIKIRLQLQSDMRKLLAHTYRFSSQKYFLDTNYKNVTATAFDRPGALAKLCLVFASHGVNLTYVRTHCQDYKIGQPHKYRLEISLRSDDHYNFKKAKQQLEEAGIMLTESNPIRVPWFPRDQKEIGLIGQTLLEVNQSKDHPQFQDPEYRQRRDYIAKVAKQYKMGEKIPDVDYSKEETQLWKKICARLKPLHQESMCKEFLKVSQEINEIFKVTERIPQLNELSQYLKSKTGFTIKPTHGILSQRQFLNALAFKIFCSTQYLRNVKNPDYTPQPDIVHEIMGHVPMFADPSIAELSHKIGLLSLGASDEQVSKLGSLYWFTLEYGVCKQANRLKGYGAGIASSIGQINWFLGRESTKPRFEKLDIFKDCTSAYPVQTVQPVYKVTESFSDALKDLQTYGRTIMKPITTVYHEEAREIRYDRNIEAVFIQDKGPKF